MATDSSFLTKLYREFPARPVPDVCLVDALIADNWGAQVALDKTWTDWTDIPADQLDKAEILLNYFEGEALRYFLPAFIRQAVVEMEGRNSGFSNAVASLAHYLGGWSLKDYRELGLTPGQREVLDEFLAQMATNPDLLETFNFHRPDTDAAQRR